MTSNDNHHALVQKVWSYAHALRGQGILYGDYIGGRGHNAPRNLIDGGQVNFEIPGHPGQHARAGPLGLGTHLATTGGIPSNLSEA